MRLSLPFRRPGNIPLATAISFFTQLYFYLPVMTVYLLNHGLSLLQISAMHGAILITQFIAEVPTGVIADRYGRKTAWVLSVLLQFIGEVWFFFAHSYWEFMLIAVVAGVGYACASGAVEALIYDSLPGPDREGMMKKALGQISAAGRIGNLLSFMASGLILSQVTAARFSLAIGLTTASVGLGLILTLLVFEPRAALTPAAHSGGSATWHLLKSGLGVLHRSPSLRRIALLMILSEPFSFYLISLSQLYFVRAHLSEGWFGPILAAGSLLAALGERYAYWFDARLGMRTGVLTATLLPGVLYLLMAPIQTIGWAVGSFLLLYASLFIARPLLRSYANNHIATEYRATTLSIIQLLSSIYGALMGLLLGWIAGYSLSALFVFMGAVVVLAALGLRIDERHH